MVGRLEGSPSCPPRGPPWCVSTSSLVPRLPTQTGGAGVPCGCNVHFTSDRCVEFVSQGSLAPRYVLFYMTVECIST